MTERERDYVHMLETLPGVGIKSIGDQIYNVMALHSLAGNYVHRIMLM